MLIEAPNHSAIRADASHTHVFGAITDVSINSIGRYVEPSCSVDRAIATQLPK